jgi:hypothetical protein
MGVLLSVSHAERERNGMEWDNRGFKDAKLRGVGGAKRKCFKAGKRKSGGQ